MGRHKKEWGITTKDGGTLKLYRGTVLLRQERYNFRWVRNNAIEKWKKDIKNLNSTESYYFTIEPNTT